MSESSEVLRKLEGKKNNLNLQSYVIEEEQSSITIMKSVDNDENVVDLGKMMRTEVEFVHAVSAGGSVKFLPAV